MLHFKRVHSNKTLLLFDRPYSCNTVQIHFLGSFMSQTITLYVDGACKGNPGLGGWGAYIITEQGEHKICGGEPETTNNRMELTAAIEGVSFCPTDAHLIIWTDSNYVKQGITEWIHGWKKKNWNGLSKASEQGCFSSTGIKKRSGAMIISKKKLNHFNPTSETSCCDLLSEELSYCGSCSDVITENAIPVSNSHPHVVITEAKLNLQGPRQLILDTETTGFYYQDSDRIIEVGAIEMINRKLTGSSIHIYINPEKPVGDSVDVHGITDEFLIDKPKYAEIADTLFAYLKGAEIIAHNATFDMNFLDMEFKRVGLPLLSDVCDATDTLALAKNKHPGQKNSLDALVRRYEIPARDRTFHGALLDAEILADVYLAMTGGQVSFDMDALSESEEGQNKTSRQRIEVDLPVIYPNDDEINQHETWVKQFEEKHGKPCFFAK